MVRELRARLHSGRSAAPVRAARGAGARLDPERLSRAITPRTRLILDNTPGTRRAASFPPKSSPRSPDCASGRLIAINDEIYEHIWSTNIDTSAWLAAGMEDRTVTLSGLGKTYAVTGWRVGWAVAAPPLTALLRKSRLLTICAPTPFRKRAFRHWLCPRGTTRSSGGHTRGGGRCCFRRSRARGSSSRRRKALLRDVVPRNWGKTTGRSSTSRTEGRRHRRPGSSFYAKGGGIARGEFCQEGRHTTRGRAAAGERGPPGRERLSGR